MNENEIKKQTFDIEVKSVCGSFIHNILQVKEFVESRIEEYKSLEVTEESYSLAKEKRADMNRAAKKVKEDWKTALEIYNEPLEEAQSLINGINQIFKEADVVLGNKIHEIEDGLHARKVEENKAIMAQMLDATGDDELIKFATECSWIVKDQWQNKTYSSAQVKADVDKAIKDIKTAFELFQGEFRPQMLAEFKVTGDLGTAQLLGNKLAKQKEDYAKAQEEKIKAAAATTAETRTERKRPG